MSVIKVRIQKDFTVIHKGPLENPRLSFKAKGLWAYCMSRSEDWQFHVRHLATVSKDGTDAIYSALKELQEEGLVEKTQSNEGGEFGPVDYIIYPYPKEIKKNLPHRDFPHPEDPRPENPTLVSTELLVSIEKESKKEVPSSSSSPPSSAPKPEESKEEMRRVMKDFISFTDEEFEEAYRKYQFLDKAKIPHPKAWFAKVIENSRIKPPKGIDEAALKRDYAIKNRKIAEQYERKFPKSANPDFCVICLDECVLMKSGEHEKRVRYDCNVFEWEQKTGWQ